MKIASNSPNEFGKHFFSSSTFRMCSDSTVDSFTIYDTTDNSSIVVQVGTEIAVTFIREPLTIIVKPVAVSAQVWAAFSRIMAHKANIRLMAEDIHLR